MTNPLLTVDDLSVRYDSGGGDIWALRHVNLEARPGEVIGIVGESGCGKSTLASAIINLLPSAARRASGRVIFKEQDILSLPEEARRNIRGRNIAMVFQDPMTAFNPVLTLGEQLVDFQENLPHLSQAEKRSRAVEMLARVGIADPAQNCRRFVHELSGGMRQRFAIAAALLMTPDILVADEPTTALDVTMEAQIIHLLRELRSGYQGAILVITHHLGLVGELCDRVYVMYAGEVVEDGPVDEIYHHPRHPYTQALIACDPARVASARTELPTIPGRVPSLYQLPVGCSFADRCSLASEKCRTTQPPTVKVGQDHRALCHEVVP